MDVKGSNATDIAEELDQHMATVGILNWKDRLIGLGTDGASVNMGSQGGLGAILKKDIPHLMQVHCVAHKLELAVLDACKTVKYVADFQTTVKGISKFYSHSSKHQRELTSASRILGSALRKFGRWNPVCWIMSKSRIMRAINDNYSATVTHLENKASSSDRDEANAAKGLLHKLLSVRFILFLGFMCDFTTALGNLSEVFQSDHLSLSRAFDELDATLGNLEQLKSSPGYIGSKF